MKSDTIKVVVAVVLLAIAGIIIVWQFGGSGRPEPPQTEGDVFDENVEFNEGETPAMIR
jgi:hypothetical protein